MYTVHPLPVPLLFWCIIVIGSYQYHKAVLEAHTDILFLRNNSTS